MSQAVLNSAAEKLGRFDAPALNVLVGLDGFVDSIIEVVDKRMDAAHYQRVETISALGQRITRAAGLSSNLELVTRQTRLGGNGPIMAHALLEAGLKVTYIGNLGKYSIHPVFAAMADRCKKIYSLADPAQTDALEFGDGKLMLNKNAALSEVSYDRMLEVIGASTLRQLWSSSHLTALTNWTMLPHQTEIWKRLLEDMAGVQVTAGAVLFTDLADPEKREPAQLAEALALLKNFRRSHRVILGANQKESLEIAKALKLSIKADELEKNAVILRQALELDAVVIHPTKNAAYADASGSAYLAGPYCAAPKLTTGAGDNFNAGFCLGLLAGLTPQELLACGTANSGFYVRQARSASLAELCRFLSDWARRQGDPSF